MDRARLIAPPQPFSTAPLSLLSLLSYYPLFYRLFPLTGGFVGGFGGGFGGSVFLRGTFFFGIGFRAGFGAGFRAGFGVGFPVSSSAGFQAAGVFSLLTADSSPITDD